MLNKSFLISDAGDQGRISIKNLETLIVDNMGLITKEKKNVAQYMYGGDGFDIRYLTSASYPILLKTEAEFRSKYHFTSTDPTVQHEMDEFYEKHHLLYRDLFRRNVLYKTFAILEESVRMQIKMPIDCSDVLSDIFIKTGITDYKPSEQERSKTFRMLRDFMENIAYVYTNERQRQLGSKLPLLW